MGILGPNSALYMIFWSVRYFDIGGALQTAVEIPSVHDRPFTYRWGSYLLQLRTFAHRSEVILLYACVVSPLRLSVAVGRTWLMAFSSSYVFKCPHVKRVWHFRYQFEGLDRAKVNRSGTAWQD
eukprot:5084203-Pyramimonas_sp.AAC.1